MKEAKNKIIELVATKLLTDGMAWIDIDGTINFGTNKPQTNQYSENIRVFLRHQVVPDVLAMLKNDDDMAEIMTMQCLQFNQAQISNKLGHLISGWKGEILPVARAKVLASGVEKYPQRRVSKRDIRKMELAQARKELYEFEQKLTPELQEELQNVIFKLNKFMKEI